MSEELAPGLTRRPWARPLRSRGIEEDHRASTPLELFVDLCFVVAVAQAAGSLHHALADDHLGEALVGYPMVFFAIWWAWMNFTWFASAYDNDDVPYRVAVLVMIAGVLVLAAGVPRAFAEREFGVVTLGYLIMRVALVALWLRAAHDDPDRRRTDQRYAAGITACMAGWGLLLLLPSGVRGAGFVVMAAAELAVPVWAERISPTQWHPGHIAERYGLFTLIVLGESVLAATLAIQQALDAGGHVAGIAGITIGGVLTVFAMWWLYFAQPTEPLVQRARQDLDALSSRASFVWGYGHYVVFGSAAAVGAGIAVAVDQAAGASELSSRAATVAVAVPVALYLLSVWGVHLAAKRGAPPILVVLLPVTAAVVLVAGVVGLPVLAIGLVMAVAVAVSVVLTSSGARARAR